MITSIEFTELGKKILLDTDNQRAL